MKTVKFSLSRSVLRLGRTPQSFASLCTLLLALALPSAVYSATFPDPNLEAAVRSALGKPTGEVTTTDMLSLRGLGAPNQGITDLAGLESALNLEYLDLENNAISDVTPLAGLTALQELYLYSNHLTSGAPLVGLTNLLELSLDYNSIQEVSWLAGFSHLRSLGLMFNPLSSVTVLAGLTNLTDLHLNGTGTRDVNFLRSLSNLTELGLGDNGISDSSPLAGLTKLEFLGFGANPGANLEVLSGLTSLKTLYLFSDSINNLSFLGGLRNLTWLRLADNQISDLSPLAGLHNLQYLDLSWNPLASCAPLTGLAQLTGLDLSGTTLTNFTCLSGLRNLTALALSHNLARDVSPLAGLTALQNLDLNHNLIPSLNFAQGMTVLTNLDASNNELTNINALVGLMNLSFVALNGNSLDLTTGSPSANVIQALQSRGVSINSSSQSLSYVPTKGTYNGLFYAADTLTHSNSGSLTLTTTALRKFSGKLQLGGGTYAFNGAFRADGTASITVKRGKQHMLLLDLAMRGSDYATGTVSASGETWSADLLGYRVVFDGRSSRSLQAGRYTLAIEGTNSLGLPGGNGYATFTVNPAGKLSLAGSLADGTRFSQSASLSQYDQWPLYARLYSGKGSVLSWLTFSNSQTLGGDLAWSKPPGNTKRYPAGFAWVTQAAGARYTAQGRGTNAFGMTGSSLTLTLAGGDLKASLAGQFTLNAKNQAKALLTSSKLSLTLNPSTGFFSGRMVDPETRKGVAFGGVILQNQTNGSGYFLGTSTSGQVLLGQ